MKRAWKIISVGGSIIIPKTGFDAVFLRKFRSYILREVKNGSRFVLVIGGGATARDYQSALKSVRTEVTQKDLDWIGIAATQINAEFVKHMFGDKAHASIVNDPTRKVNTSKSIVVAAGWKPGRSTDYGTVMLARSYGAKDLINLSNIEYVYDKDPKKYKSAKKIKKIDWKTFRKEIVGNKWEAGKNVPFDPVASRQAEKLGLTVSILKGTNFTEVNKVLNGQGFRGTLIHP